MVIIKDDDNKTIAMEKDEQVDKTGLVGIYYKYFKDKSFGIFGTNNSFRKFLLVLTFQKERIVPREKYLDNSSDYVYNISVENAYGDMLV